MIYLIENKNLTGTIQAIISADSEIEAKCIAIQNPKFAHININTITAKELNNNTNKGIIMTSN